jgi:hypothetical protein
MRVLSGLVLASAGIVFHGGAAADDRQACAAVDGSFLTGQVVSGPRFVHGQFRQGVELSHTHVTLKADQDGRDYDVAMDNVFAAGYRPGAGVVPAPLDTIRAGDRLQLCGQLYDRGVGIHFVHTSCGQRPTSAHPDGWVKVVDGHGVAGPNLEGGTGFCRLFEPGKGRRAGN